MVSTFPCDFFSLCPSTHRHSDTILTKLRIVPRMRTTRMASRDAWVRCYLPLYKVGSAKASVSFPTVQTSLILHTFVKQEKSYHEEMGAKQQPFSNSWQWSGVSRAGDMKQDQLGRGPSFLITSCISWGRLLNHSVPSASSPVKNGHKDGTCLTWGWL